MTNKKVRLHDQRFNQGEPLSPWREKLNGIIFGSESTAGKWFDITLIIVILLSVIAVMLDSVASISEQYGTILRILEWGFTLLFTVEYILRLICVRKPWIYARSFYGIIDLISFLPLYLSFFFAGAQYMLVIRILRVLRIFRILKLVEYVGETNVLIGALLNSRRKIFVFLYSVLAIVTVFGSLLFLIEGEAAGFSSIPKSVYWAIVTLTTVGYGDITPITPLGQFLAATIMILGYAIIAVPTGIYSAELVRSFQTPLSNVACKNCGTSGHQIDAHYCRECGTQIDEEA